MKPAILNWIILVVLIIFGIGIVNYLFFKNPKKEEPQPELPPQNDYPNNLYPNNNWGNNFG